jgi:hypothetical protein
MNEQPQPQTMTEVDWNALGERLFGADLSRWRFRCPTCSHVMSIDKARAMPQYDVARLRSRRWNIEQECIGRYLPGQGCNWCAYGLFSGPFFVERGNGKKTPVFGFDMTGATP